MKRFTFWVIIFSAVLLSALVLFLERLERTTDEDTSRVTIAPQTPDQQVLQIPPALPPQRSQVRKVAIIIDDIGYDLAVVTELAALKAPLAFAVLPFTPHASEAAERLHRAGKEILLHLPMEPRSYPDNDPGKGALFSDMKNEAIRRQITRDLEAVPHVYGVNNHMGSRFMENEAGLAVVMEELAKRGLFFVDSRTTSNSAGKGAAAHAGVRFAARDVFIDHTRGYDRALANLTKLPTGLGTKGLAPLLMIGHPYPETIRALRDALPVWLDEGVEVIPVSAYLLNASDNKNVAKGRKP